MFLEKINSPEELRKLSIDELRLYADEVREFLVRTVKVCGGHLASNLGVVELTIALHYVFDCYKDKFLFDVGHQTYVHKIITGRRDGFSRLRQDGGVSGFPSPDESCADPFVTGHSSTSLSLGLGLARARDLACEKFEILPVIGDGSFSGGMVYEALSDIGESKTKLTIILNDNRMSISRNTGAISRYLTKLRLSRRYNKFRANLKKSLSALSFGAQTSALKQAKVRIKEFFLHSRLFENFGITYYGPIDGHDLTGLIGTFKKVALKSQPSIIHLVTKKGKGYPEAEENPEHFHGISAESVVSKHDSEPTLPPSFSSEVHVEKLENEQNAPVYVRHSMHVPFVIDSEIDEGKKSGNARLLNCTYDAVEREVSFSTIVGKTLTELAFDDEKIVAITAAMGIGTGLEAFGRQFPRRYFDVAIAEQHAVSLAAGLAKSGYKPFFAVYSTFLQRGFDQLLHEISINKLPVRFLIDRAGAVGSDGITHQGIFDLSYLSLMPNIVILTPKDGDELAVMIKWAANYERPIAIRYPKSYYVNDILSAVPVAMIGKFDANDGKRDVHFLSDNFRFSERIKSECYVSSFEKLKRERAEFSFGEWEILRCENSEVILLACGSRLVRLAGEIREATIINARFVKPLDTEILDAINKKGNLIITLEDNILQGGFGSAVLAHMNKTNIYAKLVCLAHPDEHLKNRDVEGAFASSGITEEHILKIIAEFRAH